MAQKDLGLDKGELKRLLVRSKKEPVNCAVGEAKDGQAVIQLDKIKSPRAVSSEMEKKFGVMKNLRWGKAEVDVEEDPKLVILVLNKPAPGIARKLKKTLKGTGFSKVEIRNEDGSVAEAIGEEEDESDETATQESMPGPVDQNGVAPPPPPPTAQNAPKTDRQDGPAFDTTGYTLRLTALIRRMAPIVAADPGRGNLLKEMAAAARAALAKQQPDTADLLDRLTDALDETSQPALDSAAATKRFAEIFKHLPQAIAADPKRGETLKALAAQARSAIGAQDPQANALLDQLEAAIAGAGKPPSMDQHIDAESKESEHEGHALPASPELQAAPKLWRETVDRVDTAVEQLKAAIRADFAGEPGDIAADIEKNIVKIDAITARFDDTLADLLQAALDATDEAARKTQLGKAKVMMADHIKYAGSEALIGLLDTNPFGVSPDIKKTLIGNLSQLAKAVA